MKELIKLGIDLYDNKIGDFSKEDADQALREELIKITGSDRPDYKVMRRNKVEVYEFLEKTLDSLIDYNLESEFKSIAEVHNVNWGDSPVFNIDNPELFKVAIIADGTNNLRRQRIENGSVVVETYMRGINIYEEFYRFLAGRVDWIKMVNRVASSYNNEIYTAIYTAIADSYDGLGDVYKKTGSFDAGELNNIIQHVEAASGVEAVIIGTKSSLGKVVGGQVSDSMKDAYNNQGFFGVFNGTPMEKIRQVHKSGTDEFLIEDHLLVVPRGAEKISKIVLEGESIIRDIPGGINQDQTLEHEFQKRSGVAVVTANKYGMYSLE